MSARRQRERARRAIVGNIRQLAALHFKARNRVRRAIKRRVGQ